MPDLSMSSIGTCIGIYESDLGVSSPGMSGADKGICLIQI